MNQKLKEIIATQLRIAAEEITDTTDIVEDLGADSLDVVEILMLIEDEFGVTIPDDEVTGLKIFSSLVSYIESHT